MNLERERQLLRLVEEALAWPAEDREARLRTDLARDPSLLADVRAMLLAAGFSERVTAHADAWARRSTSRRRSASVLAVAGLLGEGGMGRVFRAERADGVFEQIIAIKLMRRTRLPEAVAGQFARERQILARLRVRTSPSSSIAAPEGLSLLRDGAGRGRHLAIRRRREADSARLLMVSGSCCAAVRCAHAHLATS